MPPDDEPNTSPAVWVRVCAVGDVAPGAAIVVPVEPPVAVFNVGGTFHATADTCTHSTSSLGREGFIDGDVVECSFHFAQFCIRDGSPLKHPARRPLEVYAVQVRGDAVLVDLAGADIAGAGLSAWQQEVSPAG